MRQRSARLSKANSESSIKRTRSEGEGGRKRGRWTEWMDVGSVGLIGFAVALTLARPRVRRGPVGKAKQTAAAAPGQAATRRRAAWCYMGDQGN